MTSQHAIAKALGLSTATVSRALRNRGNHDPRTRALILEEAAKLGYHLPQRNHEATNAPNRVPVIGVILEAQHPRVGDLSAVALRLLHGISTAARVAKLMVHIEYLPNKDRNAEVEAMNSPALRPGNLDGLILMGDMSKEVMSVLCKRFTGVRIARRDTGIALDGIGQDDFAATNDLVTHLHQLGHEQIGFLGDGTVRSFIQARVAAFIQSMLQNGLSLTAAPVVNAGGPIMDEPISIKAVLDHIQRGTRAWICLHDNRAYRLIQELQKHGVRVPEDVSVCGYDNLPVVDGLPALTTIDWPFEDIGSEAVTRLLRRLQAPDEPIRQIIMPGKLVIRASTATKCRNTE